MLTIVGTFQVHSIDDKAVFSVLIMLVAFCLLQPNNKVLAAVELKRGLPCKLSIFIYRKKGSR